MSDQSKSGRSKSKKRKNPKYYVLGTVAFLFFCLGFIAGGNGHTKIVTKDGTVCAEIK